MVPPINNRWGQVYSGAVHGYNHYSHRSRSQRFQIQLFGWKSTSFDVKTNYGNNVFSETTWTDFSFYPKFHWSYRSSNCKLVLYFSILHWIYSARAGEFLLYCKLMLNTVNGQQKMTNLNFWMFIMKCLYRPSFKDHTIMTQII